MNMNTSDEGALITLNEAINMINERSINILANDRLKANGGNAMFSFDKVAIDKDHLVFSQENGTDFISFPLSLLTDDIFHQGDFIRFFLSNGEVWIVTLCGEEKKQVDYEEVDLADFLGQIEITKKVTIQHSQSHITINSSYDAIIISDDEEDEEKTIYFGNTMNSSNKCEFQIDDSSKILRIKKFEEHQTLRFEVYKLGLFDTPHTDIFITLFY